jgi:hypothetical protein
MGPRTADADYATRRNGRTRTAIEDDITGTTKNTEHSAKAARAKSRQAKTRCNCQGRARDQPSLTKRNEVYYYQRSTLTLIQDLPSRPCAIAQECAGTGTNWNLRGFFAYWEAGDKATLASSIPTEGLSGA